MTTKVKLIAQNPLIMRCHRIMEAFAKSDDERDFYLDRTEGFLLYIDLDKTQEELDELEKELLDNSDRYIAIPKLTFYEIKKIMEGFVNEKVYDIDTKEKLIDIIQSKEARENFLEFIYDHHSELEKWQQYYQERFRVRIIEWLRNNRFDFVFEEDLELLKAMVEKLKINTFTPRVGKDVVSARKILAAKAKTYYSNEALNPRPKRGRPPKQVVKVETEPQFSQDIYVSVPKTVKSFLFTPDYHGTASIFTFSGKFASEEDLLAHRRQQIQSQSQLELQNLQQKLQALRTLSSQWMVHNNEGDSRERMLNGEVRSTARGVAEKVETNQDDTPKQGLVVRKSKALQVKQKPESKSETQAKPAKQPAQIKKTIIKKVVDKKDLPKKSVKKSVAGAKSAVGKKAVSNKKVAAVVVKKAAAPKMRLRPLVQKKPAVKKVVPKAKPAAKQVAKPVAKQNGKKRIRK